MSLATNIISAIQTAEKNNIELNTEDTIAVIKAIKEVSVNKPLIDKALYIILLIESKAENIQSLTSREAQVFNLIGLGFNSKEIAKVLTISNETVATHRKNIIKKLQLQGSGKLQKAAFQYTQRMLNQ